MSIVEESQPFEPPPLHLSDHMSPAASAQSQRSNVGQRSDASEDLSQSPHTYGSNTKRSDPFQFGSRFLSQEDNVFEFNAWDHVETDEDYKQYSEAQFAKQRDAPESGFDCNRFNSDPAKWWNQFYKNNTSNFFKDRKWLQQEFPILASVTHPESGPVTILEVGAGAGNTAFPILANNRNPKLKVHACDFSKTAVDVMRKHQLYDEQHIQADVWDACGETLPCDLEAGSVDIIIMIFIMSALSPQEWDQTVYNMYRLLKPGGEILFRDYGRGDLAQVRFKKGRYMAENFYVRGDGTRVYFFEKDELASIWTESSKAGPSGFEILNLAVDRRLLVNRAKQLKMYRCWIQGHFRKPRGDISLKTC